MKTILKRFVAVVVVITICLGVAGMFADVVRAKDEVEEEKIYTVVMVDLGGYTLYNDSGNGYRYDCQVDEMIQATTKYIEEVKNSGREEYIAVVTYACASKVIVNFTKNYDSIIDEIKSIKYGDVRSNINDSFLEAERLLDGIDVECKKNIVNITKGINCGGVWDYIGKYNQYDGGWYNERGHFDIKYLSSYANCTYVTFERLKEKYDIYSVLMVQKYNESIETEKKLIDFTKLLCNDIQNAGYIEVEDVDTLIFDFGGWGAPIISATFNFASDYAHKDVQAVCYYSDSYFERPSTEYNEHLATMSLCLELSAWSSYEDYTIYTDNVNHAFPKFKNARELFGKIGFGDFAVNDMWQSEPTPDSVGVVAANKVLPDGSTLIALAVRGGNYEQEWAGNFTIGLSGEHDSWTASKEVIIDFLYDYIKTQNITGDVKLWIVGYSKGGAVANLVASELSYALVYGKDYSWGMEDVYTYTFEAPQGAMESLTKWRKYNNIHNILNENDLIPLVAPKEWGFARYGSKKNLPNPKYVGDDFAKTQAAMEVYLNQFIKSDEEKEFNIQTTVTYRRIKFLQYPMFCMEVPIPKYEEEEVLTKDLNNNIVTFIANDLIGSRENYYYNYQAIFRDIMCFTNGGDWNSIFDKEYMDKEFWEAVKEKLTISKFREIISPIMGTDNIVIRQQKVIDNFKKFLQEVIEEYDFGFTAITISHIGDTLGMLAWNFGVAVLKETSTSDIGDIYNLYELIQLIIQGNVVQPHYPEVTMAWMMYEDDYYGENDSIRVGRTYRVIHINCPVDVNVYSEDSNKLVASIIDDVPQEISDSYIVSYINKEGEKIVILPADTNYKIDIIATDEGEFNYTIDEYAYDVQANTRIINYYDIPIEKGENYTAKLPAMNEEELYKENKDGSTVYYMLLDTEGTEITPDIEVRGVNATNSIYDVSVKQNNEYGYVLGGGSYSVGSFAEVSACPMYGGCFLGWYCGDEVISTDEIYRFSVKENIELEARFSEVKLYTVSFVSDEGGIVLNQQIKVPTGVYLYLDAVATDGYEFDYWTGNNGSFENCYESYTKYVVPDKDVVIEAHFKKIGEASENIKEEGNDFVVDANTGSNIVLFLFVCILSLVGVIILSKGRMLYEK